jgi:hypothetical protein
LELAAARRSPADLAELRTTLREWAEVDVRLAPTAAGNPLVGELAGLSRALSTVGAIGLEALGFIEKGETAPETWISERNQRLAAIDRPEAEVMLAAVRPVRLLIQAAAVGNQGVFRR